MRGRLTVAEIEARQEAGEEVWSLLKQAGLEEAQLARLRRSFKKLGQTAKRFERWVQSGDPVADWTIVSLPVSFSDAQRLSALRRILGRMNGPPIHRKKWNENRDAVMTALRDHGVRVDELAEQRGWEAVRDAVGHMTPRETAELSVEAGRRFHSALERLILDDLLGPGWRRKVAAERVPLDPTELDANAAERLAVIEARAELDALFGRAGLTAGEREVVELWRDGWSTAESAQRLSRTEAAIRRARSDAKKKIHSVSS